MADIDVHITNRTVISALNTPGGAVYGWRDKVGRNIQDRAFSKSPVNNQANARSRGHSAPGEYKRSWRWNRFGSNGHRVRATIMNLSDHAIYVEKGRKGSGKFQVFSWTKWGGQIKWVGANTAINRRRAGANDDGEGGLDRGGRRTAARPGKNILRNATNYVMRREGLASM